MDTALSALPNGEVMYVPGAFTPEGRALIADRVPAAQRIELGMDDACAFAANTVCIGNNLVMPGCGPKLRAELESRGYKVVTVPLGLVPAHRRRGVLPDLAARPAIGRRHAAASHAQRAR